jgi:hypothetical protein
MDKLNLGTYLVQVEEQGGSFAEVGYLGGLQYPLAAAKINSGGFVVQGYNREDLKTVLARLNANGVAIWQEEYDTFEDVEENIIRHIIRTSRPLPFMTGSMGNSLFFNGFYNYSFSMGFVNANDGNLTGVINGPGVDDAISGAVHINGSEFAMARYSYLENEIVPSYNVSVNGIEVTGDLEGLKFDELTQQAKFSIKKVNTDGKPAVIYGSETKSGQILLLAYSQADQTLLGSRYLGFGQPYQMADFATTPDGGLIVLASTHVTGRFPRMALFKLSETDLKTLVGGNSGVRGSGCEVRGARFGVRGSGCEFRVSGCEVQGASYWFLIRMLQVWKFYLCNSDLCCFLSFEICDLQPQVPLLIRRYRVFHGLVKVL